MCRYREWEQKKIKKKKRYEMHRNKTLEPDSRRCTSLTRETHVDTRHSASYKWSLFFFCCSHSTPLTLFLFLHLNDDNFRPSQTGDSFVVGGDFILSFVRMHWNDKPPQNWPSQMMIKTQTHTPTHCRARLSVVENTRRMHARRWYTDRADRGESNHTRLPSYSREQKRVLRTFNYPFSVL